MHNVLVQKKVDPICVLVRMLVDLVSLSVGMGAMKLFCMKNDRKCSMDLYISANSCIFAVLKYKSIFMPQMINTGKELIRINPAKNAIEYSTNQGRSWFGRYAGTFCGTFRDLLPFGNEIIAISDKGVYYSTNEGRSWMSRYTGTSCGEFLSLADGGRELLAQTSKGLYYSTTSGRSWIKRN